MAEFNEVFLPYRYFPDPTRGRPVFNGFIYVGNPDTDPEQPQNQKQVNAVQESGANVDVAQPIRTNAGGVPQISGSPVQLRVEGEYSIKVLDANRQQVYFAPILVSGQAPAFVTRDQVVPTTVNISDRLLNNTLFQTNTSWLTYYNANQPTLNLGDLGTAPFEAENIPTNRFDLAQNTSSTDLGSIV